MGVSASRAVCGISGCSDRARKRGLCNTHYAQVWRASQQPMLKKRDFEWDEIVTSTDYRLALAQIQARAAQASLVHGHPDTAFPETLDRLLADIELIARTAIVKRDRLLEEEA